MLHLLSPEVAATSAAATTSVVQLLYSSPRLPPALLDSIELVELIPGYARRR